MKPLRFLPGKRFLFRGSLQKKLILLFFFLIIIPIVLTSFISYQNYRRSISKNTAKYMTEAISNFQSKLEENISNMITITKIPLYSEELQRFLVDPEMELEKQKKIDFYIGLMNNINKDMSSTYILDNYGHIFYRVKTDSVRQDVDIRYPEWQRLVAGQGGNPVILGTQLIEIPNHDPYYVFSVIREIRDINSFNKVGTIVVDTKLDIIENTVKQFDLVTSGMTLIIDRNNEVIYDSAGRWTGRPLGEPEMVQGIDGGQNSLEMTIKGVRYIATYNISAVTGWKTIVYIPVESLYRDMAITRNITLLATLLVVMLALSLAIIMSLRMTLPLRKLSKLMGEVRGGNLDLSFDVRSHDEVGVLGTHFNRMLQRVRELIDEIYWIQNKKREAELEALQSQINPHFIYNTLETIRMKAELNDDADVAEMTFILGKLLQYSINRGKETVTVLEEIQHLEKYIQLLRFRFKNHFELSWEIPEAIMDYRLLKLTFQPVVENAILHGLEGKKNKVDIRIYTEVIGNMLRFHIRDEGNGVPPATLRHMQQYLEGKGQKTDLKSGIGLRNINDRIKLQYGDLYGLCIDSQVGVGTLVTLTLPYNGELR